jgi:hypothetical protein
MQVGKKWLGDLSSMGLNDFIEIFIRAKSESYDGQTFEPNVVFNAICGRKHLVLL